MEEDNKYAWEIDPAKYLEQNINEAIIAKTTESISVSKQQKIAFLNELTNLPQGRKAAIRYSIVILDLSPHKLDFPLSHKDLFVKYVEELANNYFEENPLSQLAVIGMSDGKAHIICDFSCSAKDIVRLLRIFINDRFKKRA